MTHKTVRIGALARVEGEGALVVHARDGRITGLELRVYEPPRFFEALLRGRAHDEPPDITARICGICPVAYQMSACQAIEAACGAEMTGPLRDLRLLLYYGEWIESHALHVYLLHAPDFLGYDSGVAMAADRRDPVERGLHLKKAGNELIAAIGGRPIHPVNVRVGGFYRVPSRRELAPVAERLRRARDHALATVEWVAGFDFCDEALRLLDGYAEPERPCVPVEPRPGVGHGASEAPRGTLYHRYRLDEGGLVAEADIVPPTAQNQARIEADLHELLAPRLALPEDELALMCEKAIRNHDPCISCSAHFLDFRLDRDFRHG